METDISIVNDSERRFEAWGAVNVVDRVGELVPVDIVERLMPVYMKRGGILMDSHSGRHVGRVEKWEKRFNEKANADGIYLWGCVFNDLKIDSTIWEFIKEGKYKGISIGGQDFGRKMSCNKDRCFNEMEDMEFWEFSLVPSPMNKQAWITSFNGIAKVDEELLPSNWKLREKLANLEHEQWVHWTKYMIDMFDEEHCKKWKEQIDSPYSDLSEKEKDSDREWADKVIDIVYGKSIEKSAVIPDPTVRTKDEKIVGVPMTVAPKGTVGSPLAEMDDGRKELLGKLFKKIDSLYVRN